MIVSVVVHMFSTAILKAYRKPRELTWVTGFILSNLALGFGFSGYLLPWNELAFFATAVGTDSVKGVPIVGQWLLEVMRGGPDVTIHTLYRFFAHMASPSFGLFQNGVRLDRIWTERHKRVLADYNANHPQMAKRFLQEDGKSVL